MNNKFKWSEKLIASALANQVLNKEHLVFVDNCSWTGNECDVLVVTRDLRIIDIEIKISRADFKADGVKSKWWDKYSINENTGRYSRLKEPVAREHPVKVWKHYYAMPKEIWKPELEEFLPSKSCGIILLTERNGKIVATIERRATPNRKADVISEHDVISIARLANLRMWSAYDDLEKLKRLTSPTKSI